MIFLTGLNNSSTIKCLFASVLYIQEGYSGVTGHSYREVCATTALEIFKYRKSFLKFQNVLCKGSFQTVRNFYLKCKERVCIIAKELKHIQ